MKQAFKYQMVKLGNILTYLDERVELDDFTEYITITVKRRHGGLEEREQLFGHQIKTKKQFQLIPGSFIISRVQCWHQAFAIVPDNLPPTMIASTNYDQFAISPEVDPKYFWWFSHSPYFTETVRSSAVGVVIEKMVFKRDEWLKKEIPLPPLAEQQRIVAKIEQLAPKVEEACKFRLLSVEKTSAILKSELGRIVDSNLVNGKLSDCLLSKPRNGWSARCDNSENGVAILTLSAVTGFRYQASEYKRTSLLTSPDAYYWLQKGDLLITRSNTPALVGHAAIYNGTPSPCIYPDLMMRIDVNEKKVDKRFVWYWLQSPLVREYIQSNAKGTSPTMKKISQGTVMDIPFPITLTLPQQCRIVAYLDNLQAKIDSLKQFQAQTQTEFDALLPSILDKAFRGEL